MPSSDSLNAPALSPSDFLLPPEEFVAKCAQLIGLSAEELDSDDARRLATAVRNGANRLRIVETMTRRKTPHLTSLGFPQPGAVLREPDSFAVADVFVRYAPDDDAAFIIHAFRKISGREPTPREKLEYEFDLRRKAVNRIDLVKRIVQIHRDGGRDAAWDVLVDGNAATAAPQGRALLSFSGDMRDEAGREQLVVARHTPGLGWLFAQNMWHQPYPRAGNPIDGPPAWRLVPGWVLTGPKRTLPPGEWRMNIDLVQPTDAKLDIEICANSGIDRLVGLPLEGPCAGGMRFRLMPSHLFVEIRIFKPEQVDELCWMQLRDLSLVHIGDGE